MSTPSWLENFPERVVKAYRERGLKATDLQVSTAGGRCCALGALVFGARHTLDAAKELGCEDDDEAWAFVVGFDTTISGRRLQGTYEDEGLLAANETGRQTAEAVIAAGLKAD